ncbi:MAG TPA: 3-phenylpropionate/cinnamic acid dioxygenase subunit beta [Marinobacter sp.]|nr:3-phenylpropionate/cinnamic acid dioxygenase subunit beta [Marinobacter sp.]
MLKSNDDLKPVTADQHYEVSRFLNYEYRLLDEERFEDWLNLMHEDIHYWMPGIENRRRENLLDQGFYGTDHMAYFDDNLRDLTRRVARFLQPSAWSENPPTRNVHQVSNVEVYHGENPDEYVVHSVVQSVRARGLDEEYVLYGRRQDLLVRSPEGFRIRKRLIVIPNATLKFKNINTFL